MRSVTVFMSTYNGEKYLKEQIHSILGQSDVQVTLLVRDDGSRDGTLDILQQFANKGELRYVTGKNLGYGKSFLHLFKHVESKTDYYAYADQDDYWLDNKLISAIEKLDEVQSEKGKIYFSDLTVVDENLEETGRKTFDNLIISVGSVLVRQRVAGCTMVFDDTLYEHARKIDFDDYQFHISHEWIYLLCLAMGGKATYDQASYIKYRRHSSTTTSLGRGVKARLKREFKQYNSTKWDKSELCKVLVKYYSKEILKDKLRLIELVSKYRNSNIEKSKLIFSNELDAGNWIFNGKVKLFILTNVF